MAPNGKVIGIEHIDQLVEDSIVNIQKHHRHFDFYNPFKPHDFRDMLTSGLLEIVVGDGRLGHHIPGGYNAIHVGAAAETVPQPVIKERCLRFKMSLKLIDQMAPGGRMLIPVGPQHGNQVNEKFIEDSVE